MPDVTIVDDSLNKVNVSSKNGLFAALQNSDKATFTVAFNVAPTAAMDVVSIAAAAGEVLRLRRLVIVSPGSQTTGAIEALKLGTATAQGSGGATPSAGIVDPVAGDSTSSTVHTSDTSQATGFSQLYQFNVFVPAAAADAVPKIFDFGGPHGLAKCPTISSANGKVLVLQHPGAAGAANFNGYLEFTKESA